MNDSSYDNRSDSKHLVLDWNIVSNFPLSVKSSGAELSSSTFQNFFIIISIEVVNEKNGNGKDGIEVGIGPIIIHPKMEPKATSQELPIENRLPLNIIAKKSTSNNKLIGTEELNVESARAKRLLYLVRILLGSV